MSDLTPERLDQIEQAASAAPQRPWKVNTSAGSTSIWSGTEWVGETMLEEDTEHIANMDQATTRALIARVRIAEYQVVRLCEAIATFNEWCRDEEEKLRWPHREDLKDYANGWRKGNAQGEADAYAAAANIVRAALEKAEQDVHRQPGYLGKGRHQVRDTRRRSGRTLLRRALGGSMRNRCHPKVGNNSALSSKSVILLPRMKVRSGP